jgi:hypothetical protein
VAYCEDEGQRESEHRKEGENLTFFVKDCGKGEEGGDGVGRGGELAGPRAGGEGGREGEREGGRAWMWT